MLTLLSKRGGDVMVGHLQPVFSEWCHKTHHRGGEPENTDMDATLFAKINITQINSVQVCVWWLWQGANETNAFCITFCLTFLYVHMVVPFHFFKLWSKNLIWLPVFTEKCSILHPMMLLFCKICKVNFRMRGKLWFLWLWCISLNLV